MRRIHNIVWCLVFGVWCLVSFSSCRNEQISDDPSLRLSFSCDTVRFDTIFTTVGSATKKVKVYNANANAVIISKVTQAQQRYFHINFDGENNLGQLTDIRINGRDSLILFVNVKIDPQDNNSPVLVEDQIVFETNGNTQTLYLEAYGQDVVKIQDKTHISTFSEYTFTAVRPYLIYDTVEVTGNLIMEPGARLYFHQGSCLIAEGSVTIGREGEPRVLCCADRIDNLFDSVPYAYSAGGWDGIYIVRQQSRSARYSITNLDLISGTNGLQCINFQNFRTLISLSTIRISNTRIHNQAWNGLTLADINSVVTNTEISNCGNYCVYILGGKHNFTHSTLANYYNSTNVRIQADSYQGKGAVYLENSDSLPKITVEFSNCILTGLTKQNIVWADTTKKGFEGQFVGNYLKCDSLPNPLLPNSSAPNVYWQQSDTAKVFMNTYFEYLKYDYYDFHLAPHSPARGIADSTIATLYPIDKEGLSRDATKASAGCYEK